MKKILLISLALFSYFSVFAQTAGTLTVTTTTVTYGGSEAPSNYFVIWVQNSSGVFVKTLMAYYGNSHVSDLSNWSTATSAHNKTDAITGATLTSHAARTATWNGTNTITPRALVADGVYTVKIEMTENQGPGKIVAYTFTKGRAVSTGTISGAAQTCFSNTTVTWTPNFTGIDEVKLGNLYNVYPNPTKASIYVNAYDVKEIEILSMDGKSLLKTNQQSINLEKLSKGTYLAYISTNKGSFIKKIIKE